jgi:hypothetical protein
MQLVTFLLVITHGMVICARACQDICTGIVLTVVYKGILMEETQTRWSRELAKLMIVLS